MSRGDPWSPGMLAAGAWRCKMRWQSSRRLVTDSARSASLISRYSDGLDEMKRWEGRVRFGARTRTLTVQIGSRRERGG